MVAYAAELMNCGERSDGGMAPDLDMACERGGVREDDPRAYVTIVRDVRARHEEVVRPDRRHASSPRSAAVDRDELAERIVVADPQLGSLLVKFEVLRLGADRALSEESVVRSNHGRTFNSRVRPDLRSRSDCHFRADDAVCAHLDILSENCGRIDDGGWMNDRAHHASARFTMTLSRSASATTVSPTFATPRNFAVFARLCRLVTSRMS